MEDTHFIDKNPNEYEALAELQKRVIESMKEKSQFEEILQAYELAWNLRTEDFKAARQLGYKQYLHADSFDKDGNPMVSKIDILAIKGIREKRRKFLVDLKNQIKEVGLDKEENENGVNFITRVHNILKQVKDGYDNVRRHYNAHERVVNPTAIAQASSTSDPSTMCEEDAESVLLYIDRNDDDKIGWDEFMESFVACYGRWLMRLKQTVARLADKVSNPAMKERYSTEVAKVNNVQRMMAAAFRQTKRTLAQQQEQDMTARSSKTDASKRGMEKSEDDIRIISEYIDRLSDMRREKAKANSNLENTFILNDGVFSLSQLTSRGTNDSNSTSSFGIFSNLVDDNFYYTKNPDVAAAGIDPEAHYYSNGHLEGRDPNWWFDTSFYLQNNSDVANAQNASGLNPLEHFMTSGNLTRDPMSFFDTSFYLQTNPDVAAAGINPLLHYLENGFQETRSPYEGFSSSGYLRANPDVAAAGVNPLEHWIYHGRFEGRGQDSLFNYNEFDFF